MSRQILSNQHIHPAIQQSIATSHADIVAEVQSMVANNKVVVIGMAQNPAPKKARKALTELGVEHSYLEYGSYFNNWYRRNALKMWTGWSTFPMIFVNGVLIGGNSELKALIEADKLTELL